MKRVFFKLPKVNIPNMATKDFACSSYTDHNGNRQIDFSCEPYASEGNIDVSKGIFRIIWDFLFG